MLAGTTIVVSSIYHCVTITYYKNRPSIKHHRTELSKINIWQSILQHVPNILSVLKTDVLRKILRKLIGLIFGGNFEPAARPLRDLRETDHSDETEHCEPASETGRRPPVEVRPIVGRKLLHNPTQLPTAREQHHRTSSQPPNGYTDVNTSELRQMVSIWKYRRTTRYRYRTFKVSTEGWMFNF